MRNAKATARRALYIALLFGAISVSVMGYHQIEQSRRDNVHDLSTWLSKKEISHLIRFHGTDALKVTRDEVYIFRDGRWVPVKKRQQG
jgi:hypothetical protein